MNYAIVENGTVTNIIWLLPSNAEGFPNAVALDDRPVAIGDIYTDGKFYRDGEEVKTLYELYDSAIQTIDELCDYVAGVEE